MFLSDDFSNNCKTTTNGIDYYGTTAVTQNGSTCIDWSNTTSYKFLEDHLNYCRNPFGEGAAPWCYYSGSSWMYCDIPMCG